MTKTPNNLRGRRIAIFSGAFARVGGIEVFAADLARLFAAAGAEVALLHWPVRGRSPLLDAIESAGVRLVRGPLTRGVRWDLPDRALIYRARADLPRADLVLFTKLPSNASLRALFAHFPEPDVAPNPSGWKPALRTRFIYVPPYMPEEDETYTYSPRPDPALLKRIDCIIAQSARMADQVRGFLQYTGRIARLPYLSSFDPPWERQAPAWPRTPEPGAPADSHAPPNSPSPTATFKVAFAGRLARQKNIPSLLESIVQYRALETATAAPRLYLNLHGEGPEREAIERAIVSHNLTDRVTLHGPYTRADLPGIAAANHCFAQTTLSEGQCLAAIEALACGRPMISTRAGCLDEVISGPELGRIGEPGPDLPVRFAEALANLAHDIFSGAINPEAIHDSWRERFSHDVVAPQYLALAREMMEGTP